MGIGNRRVGKLLPFPVTPPDTVCIKIEVPNAVEYIAAFFGQLDILGSWWTWDHPTDGTECVDCEEAAQLWRTAIYEAQRSKSMCCGCDPSISDRFAANTYMTETNAAYEDTFETWDAAGQTVVSIAPNLDFATGDPTSIDKVMCSSVSILLSTIMQSAIAYKRATAQEKKDIQKNLADVFAALAAAGGAAIAAGGILAAGMAFLGGPLTVFGLAMAAVGLFVANVVETVDLSVLQDTEAIELIRCTLAQNIMGETLTRSRFQGALSPNHFPVGGNAEKLAAIVQPYLDDLTVYLQFLVTGNGLYDAVDLGELPECDVCPPIETCYEFTEDNQGWIAVDNATYTDTVGWAATASGQFQLQNGNHTQGANAVKITFNNGFFDGSNDFHKFFVVLSDYGGGNSQGFGTGAGPLLVAPGGSITLTSTGAAWVGLNVQIAAGGYTWPSGVYIEEICAIES